MRSYLLPVLSSCAIVTVLLAGCVKSDTRDYYPENRTATSPVPERLVQDFSTNVYDNTAVNANSERVIVATEEAVDWSVKPEPKPVVAKMPVAKPAPVTILPSEKPVITAMSPRPAVSQDVGNDYLGDAYKATSSSVLESYKQVAGSNFDTRSSMNSSSNSMPTPMPNNVVSGGSVEIFDLDDGASMSSGGMTQTTNTAQSYQAREGVIIYPLDGVNPMQPQYAPTPMPTNIGVSGYDSNNGQIYFKHGSDRLGSGDKRRLSDIAQQAKTAGRVEVEGYASKPTQAKDTVTSKVLNLKESMNRSFAVSKDLIKKGVPADKIKTVGWGEAQATGDNAKDRRVDVTVNPY